MVEFAMCIPFLLMVIIGIIYFGRYFFTAQILLHAAQEGARMAAKMPNLSDPSVRDSIRGFTTDGAAAGPEIAAENPSPIYGALSAAKMLSGSDRSSGDLPPGASVRILPWDDGGSSSNTVTVEIKYPFSLTMDFQTGESAGGYDTVDIALSGNSQDTPVSFGSMTIQESATAAQEIFQE